MPVFGTRLTFCWLVRDLWNLMKRSVLNEFILRSSLLVHHAHTNIQGHCPKQNCFSFDTNYCKLTWMPLRQQRRRIRKVLFDFPPRTFCDNIADQPMIEEGKNILEADSSNPWLIVSGSFSCIHVPHYLSPLSLKTHKVGRRLVLPRNHKALGHYLKPQLMKWVAKVKRLRSTAI